MGSDRQLRVYDFHQLRLGHCAEEALTRTLHARFGCFVQTGPGPCDILFDYHRVGEDRPAPVPADDARPIYESAMGQVHYSDRSDQMLVRTVWPIYAVCNPRTGETTVSVSGAVDEHLWALSHPLVTVPLIETLKRRGLFSLHAAGVAVGRKVLLLPGSSGSGKSTLALALVRAGFGLLSDDMLFLSREGEGLRVLAFPEPFDLTDDSVRLFPELADLLTIDRPPGWPKRQLRAEERFGAEIVWHGRPLVLVFPRVSGSSRSTLAPMDRREALLEIIPSILLTDARASQEHLDTLARLVSSCACYRLESGTDFAEIAGRLRDLLERAD